MANAANVARRLWPKSVTLRFLIGLAAAIFMVAIIIMIARWDRLPKLEEMSITAPTSMPFKVQQDDEWTPTDIQADGFAKAADNERYTLLLDPKTSQIAVRNKETGYVWRSNPTPESIAQETVKGALLENLQSPFVLEYVAEGETRKILSNAMDTKMKASYIPMEGGIQVTYTYEQEELSFVIQYQLTDQGVEVTVPDEGIKEAGPFKLYSLDILPFFGAVSGTEENGYLFVPDGPGGLIHYDYERPAVVKGYEFAIYGDDPSNLKDHNMWPVQREAISYPVYGLVRGDQAFTAIVEEGKYTTTVKASPSGIAASYHSLSASFKYRNEYGRRVSGLTNEVVNTIQKERMKSDHRVQFRFLSGENANYTGMAKAYRSYMLENGLLADTMQAVNEIPLQLAIVGGGTKARFGGYSYEPATTFEQAGQMIDDIMKQGISNITVTYQGWQDSGRMYSDQRLPIQSKLGGTEAAKTFIEKMNKNGINVLFEDFIGWKNEDYTQFSIKSDGVRSIDTTVLQEKYGMMGNESIFGSMKTRFIVNPILAIRKQKDVIDELKDIGVNGILYTDGPGNLVYTDYQTNAPLTRADTAYYYNALLDYTKKQLGSVGVGRGHDYSLSHSDYVEDITSAPSYDFMVDETVPFYPLVIHGSIPYSTAPANLRESYEDDFLRAIEYGAVPYFELTYLPSRVLKGTDYGYVYSSEYTVWKDRLIEEYHQFNRLASVYNQQMINHEKLSDKVYVTTYADGTQVTVDYNTKQFKVTEGGK
ncbi:DUF5696 domain-containing protein [Paenibacillus marinisediminis]